MRPFKDRPGRGFVLSHTPLVLERMRTEAEERRRAVNEWSRGLDRAIEASALSQSDRNAVWRHIKADCPQERTFLEHPETQRLIRENGATPAFPPELILAARRKERGNS